MRAPYWHLCRDHVGIVVRAPIPARRKVVLLSQLARTMASRAPRLFGELVQLVNVERGTRAAIPPAVRVDGGGGPRCAAGHARAG